MSGPVLPIDPAVPVIAECMDALAAMFDPDSVNPPLGGGTTVVRFIAGAGPAEGMWIAHKDEAGCGEPFLWVRAALRYRSRSFPADTPSTSACNDPKVLSVEFGVGRCAVTAAEPSWGEYMAEAEVSLDDSWRLECALQSAAYRLRKFDSPVAIAAITPFGPDGGIVGWKTTADAQFG